MTAGELAMLLVGLVLVLAGALARGAWLRGRSARISRWAIGGTGLLCVTAALILASTPGPRTRGGPFAIAITDTLGPGQISEQVRTVFDGRYAGTLNIDRRSPDAGLTVTVAKTGVYAYTLKDVRHDVGQPPSDVTNSTRVDIDADTTRLHVDTDDAGRAVLHSG
jgi:hypothetical protein